MKVICGYALAFAAQVRRIALSPITWVLALFVAGGAQITHGIALAAGVPYGWICAGLFCLAMAYLIVRGVRNA